MTSLRDDIQRAAWVCFCSSQPAFFDDPEGWFNTAAQMAEKMPNGPHAELIERYGAFADAIIQAITTRLTSEEAVEAGARAVDPGIWKDDLPVPTRSDTIQFHARRQASVTEARAAIQAAIGRSTHD